MEVRQKALRTVTPVKSPTPEPVLVQVAGEQEKTVEDSSKNVATLIETLKLTEQDYSASGGKDPEVLGKIKSMTDELIKLKKLMDDEKNLAALDLDNAQPGVKEYVTKFQEENRQLKHEIDELKKAKALFEEEKNHMRMYSQSAEHRREPTPLPQQMIIQPPLTQPSEALEQAMKKFMETMKKRKGSKESLAASDDDSDEEQSGPKTDYAFKLSIESISGVPDVYTSAKVGYYIKKEVQQYLPVVPLLFDEKTRCLKEIAILRIANIAEDAEGYIQLELYNNDNQLGAWGRHYLFRKTSPDSVKLKPSIGLSEMFLFFFPIQDRPIAIKYASLLFRVEQIDPVEAFTAPVENKKLIRIPKHIWADVERPITLESVFDDQEFAITIDGTRFLPSNVLFVKVIGRVFDFSLNPIPGWGKLSTKPDLDANAQTPTFHCLETFKANEAQHRTATILLKIFGVERDSLQLFNVGFSLLNMYIDVETRAQPEPTSTNEYRLNRGAFQLPIHPGSPDLAQEFSVRSYASLPRIPCATVLMRIGSTLEISPDPPAYLDEVYDSSRCIPTEKEIGMYEELQTRLTTNTYRLVLSEINDSWTLTSDAEALQFIESKFKKPSASDTIDDLNYSYICKYVPKHGLFAAIDGAQNLVQKRTTLGIISLYPPGSVYNPSSLIPVSERNCRITSQIDLNSPLRCPVYADGLFPFTPEPNPRPFILFDLRSILVNQGTSIASQGWAILPLLNSDGYVNHGYYQLPLFEGQPTTAILERMSELESFVFLDELITDKVIKYVEGASVFVRLCDGRRDAEMPSARSSLTPVCCNCKIFFNIILITIVLSV